MAYQPFPNRVPSTAEYASNGVTPVPLMTSGTVYILWALAIKPTTPPITVNTTFISMIAEKDKPVEFRLAFGLVFNGNPLVFEETGPNSLLTVAYGDGSQEVSSGIFIQGRYVPGADERALVNPPIESNDFPSTIPPSFVGYMTARAISNNSNAACRAEFQIVEVEDDTFMPPDPEVSVTMF